ncbi:hypothetical protein PS9374_06995 [Planomonospora sphaerica]|uniref:Uncharacterized protein n=1 Tax=Planomonospora sphaerica TaxID=161355 RepID=A0A171DQG2_9ACTN|nr:hypothetical protein PS9374_06995 [Planomonospora sphaerica]
MPALPMPAEPAASAEEIAERLRGRVDDEVSKSRVTDLTFAPFALGLDVPLLRWCSQEMPVCSTNRMP